MSILESERGGERSELDHLVLIVKVKRRIDCDRDLIGYDEGCTQELNRPEPNGPCKLT